MPIDFYYVLVSNPCRSVLLLAKTLGIEFNLKQIKYNLYEHRSTEFMKINPQHCVPTLVDDGFVLWESRAILGYLVNQYAKDDSLYPKDPKKRALVDQRLYFDMGTLYTKLISYLNDRQSDNGPSEETITNLEEALQLLDKLLEGQDWVAGSNITIADYSIVVNIAHLELIGYDISKFQNILKWFPRAKTAIKGYDEIQDAGAVELKKFLVRLGNK